ncbi:MULTISPECIES: Swt1 family HEPN domain-containing protein [Bradyrhizobium]|uniref:Swt1 family HEPN domain-containing protein n=1 Tax=Bradyrhizobium TaxID=374 RepID=UPI00155DF9F1|nr:MULTISPECIES: Swt1 family HEPN domain-containing protein [Bradyrhizobium]MDD1520206.1 hypothetical protein [Bradyrhizobium sp. WBAH30]MDD1545097.1 hypothetical protein [Bradyrhizobium sp. WBAH41]MDD1558526.1 hypothetical protein [Bradyrhizobium sp. WBAH23]MDD1565924.1 hypothetical protein [Bradyrhizobium sp. WBAH33]MDD1591304.1 hypothetical protein [Bradyrhizobium sp. WBAH42]
MADFFNLFAKAVVRANLDKVEQAAAFLWWAEQRDRKPSASIPEVCAYFAEARLPKPNSTRLDNDFRKSKLVSRANGTRFRLSHKGLEWGAELFGVFATDETVEAERTANSVVSDIDLTRCPYISDGDLADARKMAELHVALFSLENSVRRHIEKILTASLGDTWWDQAASAPMKRKEQERRANEAQNKWIPSRSTYGPLYSLDWPDLATLIRKYEDLFRASIGDINFLHRFIDLGNLRNVVAHNGVIDEPMQFRRVELAIHDWIKQVG